MHTLQTHSHACLNMNNSKIGKPTPLFFSQTTQYRQLQESFMKPPIYCNITGWGTPNNVMFNKCHKS